MVSRTRLLPPLGTLRVFEAAARHQSLVRAAEELHVTHGAVSRQIQALEDHLGERVFERRNRGLFLTDRGKWLSPQAHGPVRRADRHVSGFLRAWATKAPDRLVRADIVPQADDPALADLRRETGLDIRFLAAGGTWLKAWPMISRMRFCGYGAL
jgi:DNA-binding transcriptional LysR family regulator